MDEALLLQLPDSDLSGGRAWKVVVNEHFPRVILNHLGLTGSLEPAHWFSLATDDSRLWSLLKNDDASFIHLDQEKSPPGDESQAWHRDSDVQGRPKSLELCGEELAADPEVVECVRERGSVRVSGTAQQLGMGVRCCRDQPETLAPVSMPLLTQLPLLGPIQRETKLVK